MKAVRLIDVERIKLVDVEIPKVRDFDVLVKVRAAGVCHTDVHIKRGYVAGFSIKALGFKLPLTLGHEIAGVIEEVGDKVQGFRKNDLVVVNPWMGCDSCYYCKIGENNLCESPIHLGINLDGGFAEYVRVPHYKYLLRINNISPEEAAPLSCSGVTSYRALRKAELEPSKILTVIGAGGGLGTMIIQIAKAISGATIIGVDVKEDALKIAEKSGADHVINAGERDAVNEILRITGGKGADAIIDLVGSERTLSAYPSALAKRGKYIIVGMKGDEIKYPSGPLIFKEAQFIGSFIGSQSDFINVVNLAEKGRIKPIVTVIGGLENAEKALENLEYGRVIGRQILIP
ncbi:MAG: NAD(P)-dependent alcohol dehydrogenase [Candidatus Bathyarchaeia archaeon]